MVKKIFNISLIVLAVFVFMPVLKINAFTPLTLVSYDVSDTDISPNNDGIQDSVSIDVKYSEEVTADINVLNAGGNKVRNIYHSDTVTNPQSKIWDGKDDSGQIVPNGLYTIQILGTATADPTNTISDTSKTISVNNPVPVTLSSIAITTPATKLNYLVGESLDTTGLVVTGTYSDGSTKTETITNANITGFNSTAPAANQVLTITDGTQTTTYTINITEVTIGGSSPTPIHLNIDTSVDVPSGCSATDTDGVVHNYPKGNSYLAICAMEIAINNGSISNTKFSNQFPTLGLFITSINAVTADPNSQYWAIYQNGNFASSGITSLPVVAGDTIMFQLHDFSDNNLGDQVTLHIHSLVDSAPSSGNENGNNIVSSGGGAYIQPTFDIQKALIYLKGVQSSDGSFGESSLYTDWAAIAFGALNVTDQSKTSLLSYFNSHNTLSSLLTDNERHAMALLALNQNPYAFNGVDYIKAITNSFDGTQFGDASLVNDDIFALIPLKNSGYIGSDDIIIKDVAFIISKQKTDGSWEESVDITAATIQALKSLESITGVPDALTKATNYLTNAQANDGGWNSVYSTSWVMGAMNALSLSWTKGSHTPMNYLGAQQAMDGGMLSPSETLQNRIWATSYAISAGSQKSWNEIMQNFPKPELEKKVDKKVAVIPKTEKPATLAVKELPKNTNTLSVNSNELTASVGSALPAQAGAPEKTSHAIPITLGVLSGIAVLFLIAKFFIL